MRIKNTFSVLLLSLLLTFALTGCEQVSLEETETAVNSACESFDAQAAVDAIKAYCDTHDDSAQIEGVLAEKFEALCSAGEYQNFEFMDSVVALLADSPLQEGLQKILDDNGVARAESFLEGTWVRCDGTNLDGCEMTIKTSNAAILGIITDASNIKEDDSREAFKEGDIKWDNVSILDGTMITFDSLSKNDTGYYNYSSSSGEIDYTHSTIYVHVTSGNTGGYARGTDQVWVKKDFIDRYSNVESLSEEDSHFSALSLEGTGEIEELSCVGSQVAIYWFDPVVDQTEDILDIVTTARDVHITTPKQEVLEKYGIGDFKLFNKDTDELYLYIASSYPDATTLLTEQCISSVSYSSAYSNVTFYFDTEDKVAWVLFGAL